MNDTPFFSIIIPVYNVAPYLKECLDSVTVAMDACSVPCEVICVDDGSTDGSNDILKTIAGRDDRFFVLTKLNGGLASARNAAFSHIRGEWVCFVDSDDVVCHEWLESAYTTIRQESPEMVRQWFRFYHPEREESRKIEYPPKIEAITYSSRDEVFRWGWRTWVNGGWVWLCFIKADLLRSSGVVYPESAKVKEDVIFDMNFLLHLAKVSQNVCDGYLYRMRGDSLWHKPRELEACIVFARQCMDIWRLHRERLATLGMTAEARATMTRMLWNDFCEWVDFGKNRGSAGFKEWRKWLKKFIVEDMFDLSALPYRSRLGIISLLHLRTSVFIRLDRIVLYERIRIGRLIRRIFSAVFVTKH